MVCMEFIIECPGRSPGIFLVYNRNTSFNTKFSSHQYTNLYRKDIILAISMQNCMIDVKKSIMQSNITYYNEDMILENIIQLDTLVINVTTMVHLDKLVQRSCCFVE